MSLDTGIDAGRGGIPDVNRLAAAARSILACPDDVSLVIDGIDDITAGLDQDHLEMQDHSGRPVFACPADSALALAAHDRRGALLTLRSGLGRPGSPDRDATLTLSGRLEASGVEECDCCCDMRLRVSLHLDFAVLARESAPDVAPEETRLRVPLAAFGSRAHDLNRGFLQRAVEHANACHQDELRRAIATRTHTRLGDVVGVSLADLQTTAVVLRWVDIDGAHDAELRFPRAATSAADLGALLRSELHAGLC
ncbi:MULTISPECIES: hypothetical protein [unclassified Nocardioides]|uniref:hypothetical protein n=1 Tax=unclassified Nocardioides TaxID=2615069 RepID=UPI0006F89155|nr:MULTISPECIES: hypothetical protein [unclassified Nocardioides]KRA29441.1 hypothetical protein ASD81_20875 [Nocardioides sp. Root614]KRA88384.1 hypothetical protein ASD84_20740 [Nocardioides sp. Root682]